MQSGSGPVTDPTTEAQVAENLIAAIDAQSKGAYAIAASPGNVSLLESWMANEGGLWADNPLNTSLDAARYPHQFTTGGDDTGIPIFPDIQIGVEATATTLLSNGAYASILGVLGQGDADCEAFARAVIDSPWATSHYGHDPARFCGPTATSGTSSVPVVTACLRLPVRGARSALRASRMPGACGRFAGHANGARPSQTGSARHGATRGAPARRGGHGPWISGRRAGRTAVAGRTAPGGRARR
jgi:hypothetical protein